MLVVEISRRFYLILVFSEDSYVDLLNLIIMIYLYSSQSIRVKLYTNCDRMKKIIRKSTILNVISSKGIFLKALKESCDTVEKTFNEFSSNVDDETVRSFLIVKNIASEK